LRFPLCSDAYDNLSLCIYRKAFEAEALKYQQEFYPTGLAAAFSSKDGGNFVVTVCVTSAVFNAKNY
jgi:hypothetical protein